MRLNNFWLIKAKEKEILRVVEWAQKRQKKVDELTHEEFKQAIKFESTKPTHYKKIED